ncbi:MAG: hypothetical protein E7364_05680 [Clostridiales bacterium]|nr:hypothetical protein [Clostridiales bacterium]
MKLFKKLAGLCLALTFCAGLCAVASCGGSKDKDTDKDSTPVTSEQPGEATCYTVTVLNADGTPAADARVQFCKVESDGTLGACYSPVTTDANGMCEYKDVMGFPGEGVYEIHVIGKTLKDVVRTEAAFGEYTVTLAE